MSNKEIYQQIQQLSKILGFKVPMNGFLMIVFGYPVIDIIALCERLEKIHQSPDKSLEQMLQEHYGQQAVDLLNGII